MNPCNIQISPMPIKSFTKKAAIEYAKKFNIDLNIVPIDEFHAGINIEREHSGIVSKETNVVGNNPDNVIKIALAHLIEDPRYYFYLQKQETKREKYWMTRNKPSIFLKK